MQPDGLLDPYGNRLAEPAGGSRKEVPSGEPIAIVGMACRFPGARNLAAFWRLLEAGRNAVIEGVPGSGAGRVGELFPDPSVPSEACRFGAYLDGIDQFDARFFRISPVEAQLLDPQQRLMLETSWQALEDAGIDPDRLKGSRTGVYAGISNYDYRALILDSGEYTEPAKSLYSVTGTSFNTAIGRVAFVLGLGGPALALDTACSSSLVAIHQAVSGLQRGEAEMALAGGVHAILSGRLLELRANAGMLSPDGRCATFDAAANGYVRGEGCGILVLKRLSQAEADGDRIWAVIRGAAVNQDGTTPGLTVPNQAAQEQVIKEALFRAGVRPAEVDYVEAHGTGTEVGDPIELRSTAAAYGRGRPADLPLLIGSVKTNIGHLEPAAGVASVIKVALSMQHRTIPRHLHFLNPTPQVDWDRLCLRVTSAPMEWPFHSDRPLRAGVSGFGWSGTNAHVVVEGYEAANRADAGLDLRQRPVGSPRPISVSLPGRIPEPALAEKGLARRKTRLLPLSARSDKALRQLAERYLSWLAEHPGDPLLWDLAWTAGVGRSHFRHRAGVVFRDAGSLREGLRGIIEPEGGWGTDPGPEAVAKVAFAYTGQASQWVGMGESLYQSEPVVRAVLDRCEEVFREERGASLLDVMFGRGDRTGNLDDPAWTQPAIYALECALTALWSSVGVRPSVVVGHSLGELAAAQAGGVFSLEDGLRFASTRGVLMANLPGGGAMGAIFATASRVAATVEEMNASSEGPNLSVAADNGAHQAVSGPAADVESILERFEREGVRVRRLRKSPAYHSALTEPALDDLEAALAGVAIAPPSLTFVSTLTGRAIGPGTALDGTYWRRQTREPVAFRSAVATLAELGVEAIVELGPHAVLGPMVVLAWPEPAGSAGSPAVLSSLRRPGRQVSEEEAGDAFVAAVARAYETGLPISFPGLFAGESRRRISLPGYPFQRESHWIRAPKRRRLAAGHPLLGTRHESASGEISFETEVFPSDPAWLDDHRVFGRLLAPGALYGAMGAAASVAEGAGLQVLEDMQLRNPLVFPEGTSEEGSGDGGRKLQLLVDASGEEPSRRVRILSRGDAGEEWTLHAEGRISPVSREPKVAPRLDPEDLKAGLSSQDVAAIYRSKASVGIDLGPQFRTLKAVWSRAGEALGEVAIPNLPDGIQLDVHPLLLDGCFQVMSAAQGPAGTGDGATYLPFAWDRLWLTGRLPERVVCHARMRENSPDRAPDSNTADPPEILTGDLRIYDPSGVLLGGLNGYTVKRATRAALLSAVEGLQELLYEIVWPERALAPGLPVADFLPSPETVAAPSGPFSQYLAAEGVGSEDRDSMLADLERLSRSYALSTLDKLGWERRAGVSADSEDLRRRLKIVGDHGRLFRRMLEMLAQAGVLEEVGDGFVVVVGSEDPLPEGMGDPEESAIRTARLYPHGSNEIGLLRRCAAALTEVLRGRADPLALLFSSGEPSAADLYLKAPVARAGNRMLGDAVRALVAALPADRRLRVVEVGAGTGSATTSVLPELPSGRFDYTYTDITAGFFAKAETRFGDADGAIEYRVLDLEKDPVAQGFDWHGYDLLIASNVLHATRDLQETLTHCRRLLAPSGQLLALENLRAQGWLDLTFGQLDGWWRFADSYRPHHAVAGPAVWRQALGDTGFDEVEVLGVDESESAGMPDRGVIVARGPAEVDEPQGAWILAADEGGVAAGLAAELAARNQRVVLASRYAPAVRGRAENGSGIVSTKLELERRESWRSLVNDLPDDVPLGGVVHLAALDGHGPGATSAEMAEDSRRAAETALALVQGVADSDVIPGKGVWLVTRGAQVLERERTGELAGALLWGFGKVVAREASQLQPRMIDLDPDAAALPSRLADELLHPDPETHIAYRGDFRRVARLVRAGAGAERLSLPQGTGWRLEPGPGGALKRLQVEPMPARPLEPREVRVAVEATGLNFRDVLRSMGLIDKGLLGREMSGHVLEVGSGVSNVAVGDRVVGLGFGTFGPEVVTREELVAPAPPEVAAAALATLPTAFVTAALSYELAGLKSGERVLIHSGAGGVGLAAIQLAGAAGARVFTTASAPKWAYLRSLGVEHVFDSRQTAFGGEILEATAGAGVDVVLNSLTGEGFIDASLSCLAQGGRFVELARRDILSQEEMAAVRPDVAYSILELDSLKERDPAGPGAVLERVMDQLAAGAVTPLRHSRWPLSEARAAMRFMRAARHLGKIVLTTSPLARGRLREDRTYLVTGGLGGIGCALADWLADRGAGAIVLNGRRPPDEAAEKVIGALRNRGATVRVELADVTDAGAVEEMLARMDRELPPLGGVIHSVGVLSDQSLGNQSWDRFEQVLWPKVMGAWHLHRATLDRDPDLFVLFSSVAGILGNPGQANHAAANAFLDQLAGHRRALGLPGQAIAWGAWSGLGEAEEHRERIARQLEASGTGWISPQQGLRAFERLVRDDVTAALVAAVDWPVYGQAVDGRPPLLEDLLSDVAETGADSPALAGDLISRLRKAPPAAHEELLVSFLRQEVQAVLRLPAAPAPTAAFSDLGMDSLMAVELRNRLNRAFSGEYAAPNTIVFDYPDISGLAGHLAMELGLAARGKSRHGIRPSLLAGREEAPLAQPEPEPRAAVQSEDDGIAIVGMACRFPGAPDLPAFWRQLEAGVDAVTDGRQDSGPWSGVAGDPESPDAASRRGGFVEDIDRFDSRFFRIAPIEARMMDPRQRLLLETTWHALEDAGIDPEGLKGSRTSVYVGVGNGDYRDLATASGEAHGYLGTSMSVAAGRIAFVLGLAGPAVPLDLGCASSLVAAHQATGALQQNETDLALVGGVNAVLSPAVTTFMRESGMLSESGRCRTFDAGADGFVRGEGCGMIVLKRLSEATAAGDRIWGVIRGSAVNQNGPSAGLIIPNGPAQERVIEEALSRAGVSPAAVDYLEAHGGGSNLGDPIEVLAAAAVYGRGREAERPLLLGSVKTNIGHLECAAGIASLIKVVLAMNHRVIPKHLHFRDPTPHLDWDQLPVRVTSQATAWPLGADRKPRAGVSSFGLSGINAHLMVEGYGRLDGDSATLDEERVPVGPARTVAVSRPAPAVDLPPSTGDPAPRSKRILPLSGKSDLALRDLAKRYLAWLDQRAGELSSESAVPDPVLSDVAWTAGVGRSHFQHRAGIVFQDFRSLRDELMALSEIDAGTEPDTVPRVAFAYAGWSSQWFGMGKNLYESEPVVRAVLDRCDSLLREVRGGGSLLGVLFGRTAAGGDFTDPIWAEPAVYALECALTALWSSVGIQPSIVAGAGIGELAAAQAAAVFSLEEGLRLAAVRGSVTAELRREGRATSPVEGPDAAFREFTFAPPSLVLVSGATGRAVESADVTDHAYWRRQAQEPAGLGPCGGTLANLGAEVVVEISPDAVLAPTGVRSGAGSGGGPESTRAPVVLRSLRRPSGTEAAAESDDGFVEAVAGAYEAGLPVAFAGLFAGEVRRRVSLPIYPFQRRRHWFKTPVRAASGSGH